MRLLLKKNNNQISKWSYDQQVYVIGRFLQHGYDGVLIYHIDAAQYITYNQTAKYERNRVCAAGGWRHIMQSFQRNPGGRQARE